MGGMLGVYGVYYGRRRHAGCVRGVLWENGRHAAQRALTYGRMGGMLRRELSLLLRVSPVCAESSSSLLRVIPV